MSKLQIGDKAPEINAVDQNGNQITLDQYKGKKVVLYFYPKDMTPGCTAQSCNLSENYTALQKNGYDVIASHDVLYNDLTFANTSAIAQDLMNHFVEGRYDKVVVVYNQFKNAASQNLMTEAYLPVVAPADDIATISEYIFEPEKAEIVAELIPKSLKVQLFKAVLDSHASEHGARMTAMHKATDNAGELKRELTLTYNKARQAAITGEILEIVGGAEALNG